ncbi:MAG: hypothetical protein IPG64_23295 [Haliea sp.]|nr:hypothetical protein [Haliea sp.]
MGSQLYVYMDMGSRRAILYKSKILKRPVSFWPALTFVCIWVLLNALIGVAIRQSSGIESTIASTAWVLVGFVLFFLLRQGASTSFPDENGSSLTGLTSSKMQDTTKIAFDQTNLPPDVDTESYQSSFGPRKWP